MPRPSTIVDGPTPLPLSYRIRFMTYSERRDLAARLWERISSARDAEIRRRLAAIAPAGGGEAAE